MATDNLVEIKNITKIYSRGNVHAIDNITLNIKEGEFVSLIGPTGCGKTTLLKIITGSEDYQDGSVHFKGERIFKNMDWRRAVIFQDMRIFPWMKIKDNIYFPLENKGLPKEEVKRIGDKWMDLVRIDENIRDKYPFDVSDGEKQKVGVCRVFALDPDIVLCDEPFSSLDWARRHSLQVELLKYWLNEKKTVIFVTHDIEEAVYLSQKVVCMTARPAKIKEIVSIDLPDERWDVSRGDERVIKYSTEITDILIDEIRQAAELDVGIKY